MPPKPILALTLAAALAIGGATTALADQTPTVSPRDLPRGATYTKVDGDFTLQVDDRLRPDVAEVEDFDGERRPVSSFAGPGEDDPPGLFVPGELILNGPTETAQKVAADLGGEVAKVIDPAESKVPDLAPYSVIRFKPQDADADGTARALAELSPDVAHGAHRVSDGEGLATLAEAAKLRLDKLSVDLNWVQEGTTFRTRSTTEAAGQDAFTWSHLNAITVPAAWNMLARAGRLGAKPRLAVLDNGFNAGDADRAPGGAASPSTPNPGLCSGGTPCPWHGSDVAGLMLAVPDNSFGGAGSAGPVNTPLLFDRGATVFSEMAMRIAAAASGARVINMSFTGAVPAAAYPFTGAYEVLGPALHAMGIVQVAAAGNNGTDVDRLDCFFVCWEATHWAPCETAGVTCVGGLAGTAPAGGSNFGSGGLDPAGSVDVWAPFCGLAGPNPAAPANAVHTFCGTSAASPLAAGVVGLLLSAGSVSGSTAESTLLATASGGSCSGPARCAGRIVNALAGVSALLGNLPPDLDIRATTATTVPRGTPVSFAATASDPESAPLTIRWFVDGAFAGTGATFSSPFFALAFGSHRVTATVSDGATTVGDARGGVAFSLFNTAPVMTIAAPSPGQVIVRPPGAFCRVFFGVLFCPGDVTVAATSNDLNNSPGALPDASVTWLLDGAPVATGHNAVIHTIGYANGTHTLTVRGTDGSLTGSASVPITLQ